jgi:hypothetical protein
MFMCVLRDAIQQRSSMVCGNKWERTHMTIAEMFVVQFSRKIVLWRTDLELIVMGALFQCGLIERSFWGRGDT